MTKRTPAFDNFNFSTKDLKQGKKRTMCTLHTRLLVLNNLMSFYISIKFILKIKNLLLFFYDRI